ncbi:peptide chain release factor H [Alteromonadaceae bacterium M269]|nr:peptide chain release factor H [Alteromonadaceae bacterium M269]
MILLQLSAGQGPRECSRAIALATQTFLKDCNKRKIEATLIEQVLDNSPDCYKSVLIEIKGSKAKLIADEWNGVMQWVCQSPFRPSHKRKNWFFSGQVFEVNEAEFTDEISYQTCRASGAGGQHVNTTDSAVQATHLASGISVRIESERSQHANKRLAKALIMQKLAEKKSEQIAQQDKARWSQHWDLERGNPKRKFKGTKFTS